MKKIGIVAPGHFKRLAAEVGFLHAYYNACQQGFPLPEYMTGVSAGGIAIACAAQWTEQDFVRIEKILLDLRRKDFYGINRKLEALGTLAVVPALGNFLPIDKERISRSWMRYMTKAALALLILGMDKRFIEGLFHSDSIFSNDNLYKLLERELRIPMIFSSPIKIEIASADVNSKKFSTVTNFKPADMKPEILLNGIVDSTRLPVFFPFRKTADGHYLADGAMVSNVPIHLACNHGCDVIIVLQFRCVGEGAIEKEYNQWIPGLQRSVDMLVDENARKAFRNYEFFNNDLDQEEKIKKAVAVLQRNAGRTIEEIEAIEILKSIKLSASGKKKIKFIVVDSEEIPEFHFSNFSRETTFRSLNIGYNAFASVRSKILEAINS